MPHGRGPGTLGLILTLPASPPLKELGDASHVLFDLLEVADSCGARSLEVLLDLRSHGTQSLLQPSLGCFQGPAVTVRFDGVVLSADELCFLQAPTPPFKLRGRVCR